jgi:hypothetical protein
VVDSKVFLRHLFSTQSMKHPDPTRRRDGRLLRTTCYAFIGFASLDSLLLLAVALS